MTLSRLLARRRATSWIVMNMRPIRRSWGGGNQWALQFIRALRQTEYGVSFSLGPSADVIVIASGADTKSLRDPSVSKTVTFGVEAIEAYRVRHPHVVCIHRVNECDQRKGTRHIDALIARVNAVADQTVFVSRWLRDYHAARWFDAARPHTVIHNGADEHVFSGQGSATWRPGAPLRLVTHHWSTNWNKGFRVYQELDRLIAEGRLPSTELWVIGRWPAEIHWRAARTFRPRHGAGLAQLLRQCHVYLTASRWEPGCMHIVEAAQCGLPVLYHEEGGGIVEVARPFGVGFRDDLVAAVEMIRQRYPQLRAIVLSGAPSGQRMCAAYLEVIRKVLEVTRHSGITRDRDPVATSMAGDIP